MKKYCNNCEALQNIHQMQVQQEVAVKDVIVNATITISTCANCGEEVYDRATEIKNDIHVFDLYKSKKNLLSSQDLIKIRIKYGTSQETLAKILGFGLKTITRYENGTIQDESHETLLRLIEDLKNFVNLWEKKKHTLSKSENAKIQRALDILHKRHLKDQDSNCNDQRKTKYTLGGDNYGWC